MSKVQSLREKARGSRKRVILPEGNDARVIEGASLIAKQKIAHIMLLGNEKNIAKLAKENSISLDNVEIIDPSGNQHKDKLISTFYELRKHKGITEEDAEKVVLGNTVYSAALMTRLNMADGFVAGASNTTSNVAKASIYCLKIDKKIGIVSSSFLMELANCPFGEDGLFVFGDCGIIPDPSAKQLAGIAMSCDRLMADLFDIKPKVALLSYSTKGSAKGESVEKVLAALNIIREKAPDLDVDGELQADAAIVPDVAEIKAPKSKVAGKANVLIFPNLDAGNICYKITQRLGNARVVGPILQGLTKPASDLSRGCGIEEIVDAVTVTAIRAQKIKEESEENENTCNQLR